MKSFPERQFFILERFVQLRQLPTNSQALISQKKIILLKNIYNEQRCIMKIQPKHLLESKERNVLHEASFFQKFQGHMGIPLMIWSGQDFDCLVLILQQLGLSIHDRFKMYCPNRKMRVKDACMIGIQIFDIVKNFHEKDYLHKNITPETFCFGRGEKISKLHINDLLYMKKYRAKNSLNHIQQKQNVKIQFLTPFLSKNVIKGTQASRRDDIISIIYVIIYLMKGKLPWQEDWEEDINLKKQDIKQINQKQQINFVFKIQPRQNNQIASKIQRMKKIQQNISSQQLCRELPRQIKEILDMVNELEFTQQPEYFRYIALLKKILFRSKQKNDYLFEWMESKQNFQNNLRADSNIPKLQTFKQKQLLSIVYQPFEGKVNLDVSYMEKLNKSAKPNLYSMSKDNDDLKESRTFRNTKGNISYKKTKNCQII